MRLIASDAVLMQAALIKLDEATTAMCDQQCLELTKSIVAMALPAIAGLAGVAIGAWLTARRERKYRQLAFMERQLKDFYSKMLGLRNEIRMRGELRVRIHEAADTEWKELVAASRDRGIEAMRAVSELRGPEFKKLIDYDNRQLQVELLPAYREMAKLFREIYWLADSDTQSHYEYLMEFVDVWDRWLDKAIPGEVVERLGHSEEKLKPFYEHLVEKHDELRKKVKDGIT